MSRETVQRRFEAEALRWIARLPLLREADVQLLAGAHEADVRRAIEALRRFGWIERVHVSSPEFAEDVARYLLRDVAVPQFVEAFQLEDDAVRAWPIGRSENLEHVSRVEITDGVNSLLATIAAGYRGAPIDIVDLHSLPSSRRDSDSWWPRDIEAYGCLAAGDRLAHFFVAWDRPAVPTVHRRARVRSWYEAAGAADHWSESRLPTILLACPPRLVPEWQEAVERTAERRDCNELDVLVIDQRHIPRHVTGVAWHPLGEEDAVALARWLDWRATPRPVPHARRVRHDLLARGVDIAGPTLNEWALRLLERGAGGPREQTAALALRLGANHKEVLPLIARHPYLSPDEIADVLDMPLRLVQRVLRDLHQHGLIVATGDRTGGR